MLAQQQKGINWSLNKFNLEIRRFLSVTAVRSRNSFATAAVGAENQKLLNWSLELYMRCTGTLFAYRITSQVACSADHFYMMFIILWCMRIFIYICVRVYIYMHFHIHTHIHKIPRQFQYLLCCIKTQENYMSHEAAYLDCHKAISACEKLERFMCLKSLGSGYKLWMQEILLGPC